MPKKTDVSLSAMLDSASDGGAQDDSGDDMTLRTLDSAVDKVGPAKKRGTTKVSKPKVAGRRTSGGKARKKAAAPVGRRPALREQPNGERQEQQQPSDTEEVEEFQDAAEPSGDELDTSLEVAAPVAAAKKRGRPAAGKERADAAAAAKKRRVKAPAEAAPQEKTTTGRTAKASAKTQGRARPTAKKQDKASAAVEPPAIDMDDTAALDADEAEPTPKPYRPVARPPSIQRRPRAGSVASDTERGAASDPALRRKLGEATKRLEALDLRYRNLREVGVKEAEANFDRLRKASHAKTEAATKLIGSLKSDLESKAAIAKEARALSAKLSARDGELAALRQKLASTTSALEASTAETRTLAAKLSAHRAAPPPPPPTVAARTPGPVQAQAQSQAEAARTAAAKEELYSDLTGLLVRAVTLPSSGAGGEAGTVYDCIQTGRAGTLRFKLAVAAPSPSPPTATTPGGAGAYEDAEFVFTPLFDARHDADLVALLPDYLREEITFARANAGRFYARLGEALMKRP